MSDLIQVILLYVYRNVIVLSIFKFKNYMISDYSESVFLVHQLFEVCNFLPNQILLELFCFFYIKRN